MIHYIISILFTFREGILRPTLKSETFRRPLSIVPSGATWNPGWSVRNLSKWRGTSVEEMVEGRFRICVLTSTFFLFFFEALAFDGLTKFNISEFFWVPNFVGSRVKEVAICPEKCCPRFPRSSHCGEGLLFDRDVNKYGAGAHGQRKQHAFASFCFKGQNDSKRVFANQ